MKPLVQNTADEKQVRGADLKVRLNRDSELKDIHFLMQTTQGRRFLWRYLGLCRLHKISMDQSNSQVFFNEGMRNVGIMLMTDIIEADPEGYLKMMNENKENNLNV